MTRHRKGFTLVEMIVVIVLGSLVLLAAFTVLITNQRTYTAQNAVIQGPNCWIESIKRLQ